MWLLRKANILLDHNCSRNTKNATGMEERPTTSLIYTSYKSQERKRATEISFDIHCSAGSKVIIIGKSGVRLSESALTREVLVPIMSIFYHRYTGTNLSLYWKVYLHMNYTLIPLFLSHTGLDSVPYQVTSHAIIGILIGFWTVLRRGNCTLDSYCLGRNTPSPHNPLEPWRQLALKCHP